MTPAARLLSRAADWGRAPSAHNTQPWDVRADGPDALVLGWHADRVLEVGDPTRRDLLLSLGCVAEALAIVAAEEGYAVRPAWQVHRGRRVAGRLELGPVDGAPGSVGAAEVAPFSVAELVARRTARAGYAEPFVTAEQVVEVGAAAGLGDAGRGETALGDAGIAARAGLAVLPPDVVETQLAVADRWTFDGPATGELRDWLRLDPQDPAYRRDGLSDAALGLAGWERAGLRLALQPPVLGLLRRTRLTALLGRTATARPLGTVVALTAHPDIRDDAVADLGRSLLRVWLAAARAGLALHPLSQLLDCPASSTRVQQEVTGAAGPEHTAYGVFRLGRPRTAPARSHRLTD